MPAMPFDFAALPDWAVLTDQQTTQLLGVSLDTLGRLDRAGDGPPRVRTLASSPRQAGRRAPQVGSTPLEQAPFGHYAMKQIKSPGAVAALGASEIDGLGRHVVSEISSAPIVTQAPIPATLIGSDRCEREGYTVRAYAPVLAMCRELVAAGYDPATPLEAYRGDILCLRVRSIGEGAKYTVKDNSTGTPALRRYQEPALGIARGSSIAPDVSGAPQ